MKLAAMVLTYQDRGEFTIAAVEALQREGIEPADLYVVDNGSDADVVADLARRLNGRARVLRIEHNRGIPAALNHGLSIAFATSAADAVLINMNDAVIGDGSLAKLIYAATTERDAAAVSPAQVRWNEPEVVHTVGGMIDRTTWRTHHRLNGAHVSALKSLPSSVPADYLDFTLVLIPRRGWERVGRCNEQYRFYWDDVEWCLRARSLGFRVIVATEATARHRVGGTMGTGVSVMSMRRAAHNRWACKREMSSSLATSAWAVAWEIVRFLTPKRRKHAAIQLAAWRDVFWAGRGIGEFSE